MDSLGKRLKGTDPMYTQLDASTRGFVDNATGRVDGNVISGVRDGFPMKFVGNDLCQSTEGTMADIPILKSQNIPFQSL